MVHAHRLRANFDSSPAIDRDLLVEFDKAEALWLTGYRRRLYLEARRALDAENVARQAQGLKPLRTVLKRHFRPVEARYDP